LLQLEKQFLELMMEESPVERSGSFDSVDLFLKLFPHPLSRLLMTLLWKAIAAVNLGDGREMSL
jgi:hypothetical protein